MFMMMMMMMNNLCIFYRGNSGTNITIFITYTSSDIPYCDKYIDTTKCRCSAQQQHYVDTMLATVIVTGLANLL